MPSPTLQLFAVTEDGAVPLELPEGAETLADAFAPLAPGVYTGLRTYGGDRFLRLNDHLDRTQRGVDAMGLGLTLDREQIERAFSQVASRYPDHDLRIRIDVLPEPAREYGTDARVLFAIEPRPEVPSFALEHGARVQVARGLARHEPLVKKSEFIGRRRPYPLGTEEAFEHLLLDEDSNILEGSSSNFFAVREGELWTAPAGVLEGITRRIVLELAEAEGIPIRLRALALEEVPLCDEAFLSSSSRHIVPIVEISGLRVGGGVPGPVTRRLMSAFEAYVEREQRPASTH